jgi:hypothetical protein
MKIVVIGGTGPDWLEKRRHSASGRPRGDRCFTKSRRQYDHRRWAERSLASAHVVIDLSDSLSFDLKAVLYSALLDG